MIDRSGDWVVECFASEPTLYAVGRKGATGSGLLLDWGNSSGL